MSCFREEGGLALEGGGFPWPLTGGHLLVHVSLGRKPSSVCLGVGKAARSLSGQGVPWAP